MDSRRIIQLIEAEGWYRVGQTGSHIHFKHPIKKGKVTVPHPKRDLPPKTVKSIEDVTGLRLRR